MFITKHVPKAYDAYYTIETLLHKKLYAYYKASTILCSLQHMFTSLTKRCLIALCVQKLYAYYRIYTVHKLYA